MTMNNQLDSNTSKRLKITLVRSASGRLPKHKATLVAIGLNHIGQSTSLPNNNATLGMIRVVNYLVKVEEE
jgi:large subunit ribosomal protein L30